MKSTDILMYVFYALGAIGFLVDACEYLIKDHQLFKKVATVNALIWASQYFCLASYTAGFTLIFAAARTFLSEKFNNNQKEKHIVFAVSVMGFCLFGWVSWLGYISLLPIVALIITTHAMVYKTNIGMRKEMLLSLVLWFANDLYWGAYFALASNTVGFMINLFIINKMEKQVLLEKEDLLPEPVVAT